MIKYGFKRRKSDVAISLAVDHEFLSIFMNIVSFVTIDWQLILMFMFYNIIILSIININIYAYSSCIQYFYQVEYENNLNR